MDLFDSWLRSARGLGVARLLAVVLVSSVGIAGLWGLVAWGSAPTWVPVVRDAPVELLAESARGLEDAGIEHRLTRGGSEIQVRDVDVARARVRLAEQGLPRDGRRGFELFDEPTWGMTDFTQRVNYRRALEGELERTIGQMRGVRSAKVHLAMPERSLYRAEGTPVEGSVLLRVVSGARPTEEQVEAIRFLLSSAVDGLTTENVSVLDDSGRVLSAASEPQVGAQADRRRLDMQRDMEAYLETRASELVEPMLGAANVRIRISALLDTERVERRTDAVDPNAQVLTAEERSEIEPGDPSQGAASTIQHNTFDVTRSTEVSLQMPGAVRRLTVAVAVNEESPRVQDPGVLQRIETLVANAVGLDTGRGDAISVVAVPFEPVATPEMFPTDPGPGPLDLLRDFQRPILLTLALLLTFVLALRGLKMARAVLPAAGAPERLAGVRERSAVGGASAAAAVQEGNMSEKFAVGPPADASRLVRAWLSEG